MREWAVQIVAADGTVTTQFGSESRESAEARLSLGHGRKHPDGTPLFRLVYRDSVLEGWIPA